MVEADGMYPLLAAAPATDRPNMVATECMAWYGEENENDQIKITVQFLSNEVRSDALNIKVFKKNIVACGNYYCSTVINTNLF